MSTSVSVAFGPPREVVQLPGDLVVPPSATGAIVFAHGSGSSRHSPRNRAVAKVLQENGFATLLLDLLTQEEEA
ncbi:MAG TPA: hydrolase, partial [Actinopolymorphaceae bacterium]|nr:hydrolase [Actinopolymorphaceae bacterium]